MKAKLPGKAYFAIQADPDLELLPSIGREAAADLVPVRAMDVHGSFSEQAPATARARQIVLGIVEQGDNRRIKRSTGLGAGLEVFAVTEGRDVVAILEVRGDDGRATGGRVPHSFSTYGGQPPT